MKHKILTIIVTIVALAGCRQMATAQSPAFVKFVKGGTELNMTDLRLNIKEGVIDTLYIYAQNPNNQSVHISAKGLQNWTYFMTTENGSAATATLLLIPEDDADGDYTFTFQAFDNNVATTPATASLSLHVADRNALTNNDKDVTITNYPNPVETITMLEFVVPEVGHTTLKIYTLSGREVATLVDATTQAQRYFRKLNMSSYPAGVYVYSLKVNGVGSASGRMIKL